GPSAARTGSTWIHWWSSVASANRSICFCVTSRHGLYPRCSPTDAENSSRSLKILIPRPSHQTPGPRYVHGPAPGAEPWAGSGGDDDVRARVEGFGAVRALPDHVDEPASTVERDLKLITGSTGSARAPRTCGPPLPGEGTLERDGGRWGYESRTL